MEITLLKKLIDGIKGEVKTFLKNNQSAIDKLTPKHYSEITEFEDFGPMASYGVASVGKYTEKAEKENGFDVPPHVFIVLMDAEFNKLCKIRIG